MLTLSVIIWVEKRCLTARHLRGGGSNVHLFAFTENVTIREKDSLMSSKMNVSLLLSYFYGEQNGGWGSLSLRCHGGNAA